MNDYLIGVGAALTAAGLHVDNTAAVAHGADHILDIDAACGVLELVWNESHGWLITWLDGRIAPGRAWTHNLTPDADPAAVVDEVLRALSGRVG